MNSNITNIIYQQYVEVYNLVISATNRATIGVFSINIISYIMIVQHRIIIIHLKCFHKNVRIVNNVD